VVQVVHEKTGLAKQYDEQHADHQQSQQRDALKGDGVHLFERHAQDQLLAGEYLNETWKVRDGEDNAGQEQRLQEDQRHLAQRKADVQNLGHRCVARTERWAFKDSNLKDL